MNSAKLKIEHEYHSKENLDMVLSDTFEKEHIFSLCPTYLRISKSD